jgi:hypothetical protein
MTSLLIALVFALFAAPASERTRLEQHFTVVEQELLARDVSALSAEQRAARARNIQVLREYARAGVFPHNHDFDDARMPYFRDPHGTLCAMAYLIAQSGNTELVDRVARTNNNAFIRELASDPDLIAWLERNGLSVAEAARIQPTYGPIPGDPVEDDDDDYDVLTASTAVIQGGAIAWTLVANPKRSGVWPGVAASVTGVFSMLLGAAGTTEPEESLAKFNVVSGAATTAAGIIYLYRRWHPEEAPTGAAPARWEPVVGGTVDGATRVGVSYRF